MAFSYKNLIFSGGGILGISYLGLLDYLYKINLMPSIQRVAGTSAGAITACIACLDLTLDSLLDMLNTLDYSKVPVKEDPLSQERGISEAVKNQLNKLFGNFDCVYRLIKDYGWYSSSYIYDWLQLQIASQFDPTKKQPPYTFVDFQNPDLHKDARPFKDLYIIGTDVSQVASTVFSAETTPNMEVAEAVRISMSIPLFFQCVKSICGKQDTNCTPQIFADGGLLYNYPITLFDDIYPEHETLGAYFKSTARPAPINNIVDFITNIFSCTSIIQNQLFENKESNLKRSIPIYTSDISPIDFAVKTGDETYNFLYEQGYRAAEIYFSLLIPK